MLGPLTAHTFTLLSWPSPPKQDTHVDTRPVPPLALTLMYFSTNVMFRTLHSNSTIYLSTLLPSGDVRVNIEVVFWTLTFGVGRVTIEEGMRCNQTSSKCFMRSRLTCLIVHGTEFGTRN